MASTSSLLIEGSPPVPSALTLPAPPELADVDARSVCWLDCWLDRVLDAELDCALGGKLDCALDCALADGLACRLGNGFT
jgi:hypothetical protein